MRLQRHRAEVEFLGHGRRMPNEMLGWNFGLVLTGSFDASRRAVFLGSRWRWSKLRPSRPAQALMVLKRTVQRAASFNA